MQALCVRGGKRLSGCIRISGGKNAALPVLAACVLFRKPCRVENCPRLRDVDAALDILHHLGARCSRSGDTVTVDPRSINRWDIPPSLGEQMRGSVFFLGPLMARFGRARIAQPGGCPLGKRPVDFHYAGICAMGARMDGALLASPEGLRAVRFALPYPSVGATENLLMAALGAKGETVIENAAREPEIVCLCEFLRSGGCRITGEGTSVLHVWGGLPEAGQIRLIPDRMEAATYLCAAAGAGGCVKLTDVNPAHLEPVVEILRRAGCRICCGEDCICLRSARLRAPGRIVTGPYPAFPTDAQAPVMAALLRARGCTVIRETVFEDRLHHVLPLQSMGAELRRSGDTVRILGVDRLHGARMDAPDLRGGAALVIAALAARGESRIGGMHHLQRGYEDLPGKLRALGAQVELC